MRAALTLAAAGLVIASAGFGAFYAWTVSAGHGPVLAGLAVLMAVALETCKPFALESVFACLRRWAIGRGLAMAVLAAVAILYSLTAELSLMATSRGDATASREAAQDARGKAGERYRRASAELAGLSPSRPAGELQALLAGRDCDTPTKSTKTLCGELARAERRAELQEQLDKAEKDTVDRRAVGAGDAGAAALSALLGLFGVTITPGLLATVLTLIGVVALEVGSALAVVLVRAMGSDTKSRASDGMEPRARGEPAPVEPASREAPNLVSLVTPTPKLTAKRGRKPIGDRPLSNAEKCKRYRERRITVN